MIQTNRLASRFLGRRLLLALSLATAACLLAPPRLAGAGVEVPTKRYRDSNYKFSFLYFDGWQPVPIEMSGKNEIVKNPSIAKFAQQGAEKRDLLNAEIEAFRIATGASADPTTTPGDDPAGFKKALGDELKPKTMMEVFNGLLDGWWTTRDKNYKPMITPKTAKSIQSKDDVQGQMWEFERPAQMWSGKIYWVFACWKKDDVEVGLAIDCEATQRKKLEGGFKKVVDSFLWHDDKAQDVQHLDVLNDVNLPEAKKREIEKTLVKGWGVIVSPKKNYVVIYNRVGKRNDFLAKKIAEQIERIREQIYEVLFPPSEVVDAVSVIRVCGNRMEYHQYGGPGGSAGYWNDDSEELVFYDADPNNLKPDQDTLAVLYHEAFHQFIYYSVGEVAPHSWFNEGHGDYFAGAKYAEKKFKIGPFNWRVGVVKEAIRNGPCTYEESEGQNGSKERKWNRSNNGYSPLKALVDMDQGEYYSYPSVCYAQGWSLIYFLREIVPKNAKWNEKWGKILTTYFDVLKAEVNKDKPLKPKKPKKDGPDGGGGTPPAPPTTPGGGTPPAPPPGMDGGDDPAMGGDDDPGMGGDKPTPGDDPGNPDEVFGIPMGHSRYSSSERALKKALEAAFKDVNWDELEAAWKESTLKVKG